MIYDEVLSSDPLALENRIKRIAGCHLMMSPVVAENVHDALTERLKEYEAYSGGIPTGGKIESRRNEYHH
jgi:hypothetical protein